MEKSSSLTSLLLSYLFFAEASAPLNVVLSYDHSAFVKGDQTSFEIEPSFGVEASELHDHIFLYLKEQYHCDHHPVQPKDQLKYIIASCDALMSMLR